MQEEVMTLDTILCKPDASTEQAEIDELAKKLIDVKAEIERLKNIQQSIEDSIWTRTPEEPGEVQVEGQDYLFDVKRSEIWSWDSDVLESIHALPKLPDYLSATYKVKKAEFQQLSGAEQQSLLPALEKKPGSPRVSARRK